MTVKKHLRAQEIALENRLPCIYLVDSGGAFLPLQDEVFPDRDHFGRIFYNQARMSRARHSADRGRDGLVHGRRRLRARDERRDHHRARTGHDLPRRPAAREGRDRRSRRRRNARRRRRAHVDLGRRRSFRRERRARARDRARHRREPQSQQAARRSRRVDPREPLYRGRGNLRHRAARHAQPVRYPRDHRAHRRRLGVPRIQGALRQDARCGFAHIHGYPVGIVANNGILFSESALKGAHFIELCNQRNMPLVFLQNITGFMVGRKYEHAGIAKDGAKMVTAVACSHVPKFTVIIGGSFGAGNYAMCGRGYRPRFLWMWPNARISVMGGEQAASVLATVRRDGIEASGKSVAEGRRGRLQGADPRAVRAPGPSVLRDARGSGTTASSIPPTRAACSASRFRRRSTRRSNPAASACSACKDARVASARSPCARRFSRSPVSRRGSMPVRR